MIKLTEAYNESLESPLNRLNDLLKNGVEICGFTFTIQLENSTGMSFVNSEDKVLIIKLADVNINSEYDAKKILFIVEDMKRRYLYNEVILPTVKKYSKLMQIDHLLKSIKIIPIVKNNKNVLASCKVYDDNSFDLNFSSRLTTKLKPLVEYIVIHELCHAKLGKDKEGSRGHTEEFWSLLKEYSPHYKNLADLLNASSDFID